MPYQPLMAEPARPNVYEEEIFHIRATFGASSAVTYRSKDATIAKTTTTTFTVTLPQTYAEITQFHVGRKAAAAVAGLEYIITTNNVATDGTLVLTSIVAAGTATAPASGDVIYVTIGVSRNKLNDSFTG